MYTCDTAHPDLTTHISVHANTLSSLLDLCALIFKDCCFHENNEKSVTLKIVGSILSQEDWSPWNLLPSSQTLSQATSFSTVLMV
jgi:hypothetical protein